jgi:hypothetical protein
MMNVSVRQWDTGQGSGMHVCYMMNLAVGQWDTEQCSGICVLHDGCNSGTVGHRTR